MDKKGQELLKSAQKVIGDQREELNKQSKLIQELRHFKLAFDIASILSAKEEVDPEEFQSTVIQLNEKKAEDLEQRAKILSVIDPAKSLDLGDLDDRGKTANSDIEPSGKSPTPHSTESMDAARTLINNVIE